MRQPMKRYAPISGTESTAHLSQTGYGNYLVIGWVDIDAGLLTPYKRNKKQRKIKQENHEKQLRIKWIIMQ